MRDDTAAAQVLGLLTAGLLFLGVVGVLLAKSAEPGTDSNLDGPTESAARDRQVLTLADLAATQGTGVAGADGLQRLGLATDNGSLDPARLEALRDASLSASLANGKLDYPDARAGLGLPFGQEFHVSVRRTANATAASVPILDGLRTAYIGDWTSLASVTVPLGTPLSMQNAAQAKLNLTMFSATATERAAIRGLGVDFNDRVFVSTLAPTILVDLPFPLADPPLLQYLNLPLFEGDVYPDVKSYLDANLPNRLSHYDLLIVGSGAQHSALTGNAVKQGIANWVLAGGRLVVLGSDASNYQWLQPMFATSVDAVSGAVTAANPNHPILASPYDLAWEGYNTHGLAWDIKKTGGGAHYDDFEHVLVQGGKDVLAVSEPGGFGSGFVVLSSVRPRELAPTEANHFLVNLFQPEVIEPFADLEYGPPIPDDRPVAAALRTLTLWENGAPATVEIRLFLWG